ncbi:ankyrin repeat-containing protein NPR4-like isoform X2 [Papaver somniferum]|uniref:ankyrin repeat-containing protein NPR4-like isoform X2 n=1 Tax=Papaver somniferum TaxID=3469 RepID=UPI000E704876|nr:ankyrin repeat-containing protein NPR4-like isoform X2 [Papaver somniferum]
METRGFITTDGAPAKEVRISIRQRSFNYAKCYQTTEYGRNLEQYRLLLDAAIKDKWESVEDFIRNDPSSVEVPITVCGRTALHIAAGAGHSKFVLELVKLMSIEALGLRDSYDGNTALHLAVIAGLDEAVKAMVQKDTNLARICNENELNPLLNAAIHVREEHEDIIRFLCDEMKNGEPSSFQGHLGAQLICSVTRAGLYELAYNLILEHPSLATAREDDGNTILDVLAEKGPISSLPSVRHGELSFHSDTQQCKFIDKTPTLLKVLLFLDPGYQELVNTIFEEISHMTKEDMYHFFFGSNFLKTAAEKGAIEILEKCISTYPDQLWFPHEGRNIFQIAVENRQEKTFDYLYGHMNADEKILTTRTVDSNGGNILHVAAKFVPSFQIKGGLRSSPVFQMQSEIQWFKKVEKRVPPALAKTKNDQGETPQEVFTREHKDLVKNAETYMLRTAESCLIVAALVATVAFAAAITVPGGNFSDSNATNKGMPIFLGNKSFLAFMVVDAIALFSSTFVIQVFLTVFVGSYNAEAKFEEIMPRRLEFGLVFLRISVVSVTIAFSIALMMLGNSYPWAPYVICGAAFCSCGYSLGFISAVTWRFCFLSEM